jgi:hypothetical protein
MFAAIVAKILPLLKKYWKPILIIIVLLMLTGIGRRFIGRVQLWWSLKKTQNNPTAVDWDFTAMSVHNAMYQGLLNMGENEQAIIDIINSLGSQSDFLKLCMTYNRKYQKDLREQLRKHFNDKQYAKLNYR